MNYKKILGQVAVVVVGVLAANQVQQMLNRGAVASPSATE